MSVATMSASQAVLAMKIHDETVYRQRRLLPLVLNKKYQRKLKLLKKFQANKALTNPANPDTAIPVDHQSEEGADNEIEDNSDSDSETVLEEVESDMVNDNVDATCNSEDQATGFSIQSDGGSRDDSSEPSSKKQKLDAIAIKVSQAKTDQKEKLDQVMLI